MAWLVPGGESKIVFFKRHFWGHFWEIMRNSEKLRLCQSVSNKLVWSQMGEWIEVGKTAYKLYDSYMQFFQ